MKRELPKFNSTPTGFTLVEIVVSIAMISMVILTIAQMGQLSLRLSRISGERAQAAIIAQEAVEAIRYLRDASWGIAIGPLAVSTTYYLAFSSTYNLTTTSQPLIEGLFERTITISDALRNANDDIDSAGTADASTKKFTVDVSWRTVGATTTETVEFYLTDLFQN